MKRHAAGFQLSTILAGLLLLAPALSQAGPTAAGKKKKQAPPPAKATQGFIVYTEAKSPGNHFIPSGWMGDTSDLSISDSEVLRPHSGRTCIKVGYKAQGSAGWGGIYWQNPANNWGTRPGVGYDLSQYKKLTFWARGDKGGEVLSEVKVGGIKGQYPDSDETSMKNLILSDQWTQYTVDLQGKDLNYIIGGLCVVFTKDSNPSGAVIYLDDIIFTK